MMKIFQATESRNCFRLICMIVLVSCAALCGRSSAQAPGGTETPTVKAQVVQPVTRTLTRVLSVPGSLAPYEQAALFAKVSGFVGRVHVDIGDRVKAGQVLLTLDVPEMLEEIRQAEAVVAARLATVRAVEAKALESFHTVETASAEVQRFQAQRELDKLNLQRRKELFAAKAIPQQTLDEAATALDVSEARLRVAVAKKAGVGAQQEAMAADTDVARARATVAEADLARLITLSKYAKVLAPFDGVITRRLVDPGAFVRSGAEDMEKPAFEIMMTEKLRVVMEVSEADAAWVRAGTKVSLDIVSLTREPILSAVSRTAGVIRPDTRTMRVEVDLDNADGSLTPGMYVAATLTLESKEQATIIPSKAIRTADAGTVVFVVDQGLTRSAPITIGYDDGIWAEVLSGLSGEEQVIIATSGAIIPGSRVRAIPSGS